MHDSRRSSADMMAEAAKRPGATLAKIPDGLKMGEDFPFICDICLGPNPYIRMMKLPMARECKISGRPYTAFRWQPGAEARYKETIICAEVAIAKNVCQVCLMDMEYNLPVRVRDQLMGNDNTRGVGGVQMPQSDVNKEFYWQNQRQLLEESPSPNSNPNPNPNPNPSRSPNPNPSPSSYPNPNPNSNPSPNPSANPEQESSLQGFQALQDNGSAGGSAIGQTFDKLAHLSRNKQGHDKYYDRNLPKLCSFWTRQTCTRVANTACPYRPCNGTFRFPELASTHPEALSKLVRRLRPSPSPSPSPGPGPGPSPSPSVRPSPTPTPTPAPAPEQAACGGCALVHA